MSQHDDPGEADLAVTGRAAGALLRRQGSFTTAELCTMLKAMAANERCPARREACLRMAARISTLSGAAADPLVVSDARGRKH